MPPAPISFFIISKIKKKANIHKKNASKHRHNEGFLILLNHSSIKAAQQGGKVWNSQYIKKSWNYSREDGYLHFMMLRKKFWK